MPGWYARPVLHVADLEQTRAFYIERLGFAEDWGFDEDGRRLVMQLSREGCELIFARQWPERGGMERTFLSLDRPDLDALRAQLEAEGTPVRDGWWGYDLMIVTDPDGHELWFAYPKEGD